MSVEDAADPQVDAGVDATFCELHTGHTFCEDFDRATSVPTLDGLNDPNHLIALDEGTASSSPKSLRLTYVPAKFEAESVTKNLPPGQHLKISLDIRADYTFSSGQVIALWLVLHTAGDVAGHQLYIESYGGPLRLIEAVDALDAGGSSYNGGSFSSGAPAGTFAHVDIVIDGAVGKATVDQNGARVVTMTMMQGFPSGAHSLSLGLFANSVTGGNAVLHIDNVVVDVN